MLNEQHVRASSAIPAAFPAVEVARRPGRGLVLRRRHPPQRPDQARAVARRRARDRHRPELDRARRADRIAGPERPDLFAGAAHVIDALLADPLVEDIQTLTTINELVGERRTAHYRTVPYIFIAPPERDTIGRIARDVFRRHYGGLLHAHRSPQLAFLGRLVDAGADPLHGELLSYLFFAPEFAARADRARAQGRRGVAGGAARRRPLGHRPARPSRSLDAASPRQRQRGEQHDERVDRGPVARRLDDEEDDARGTSAAAPPTASSGAARARRVVAPTIASSAKIQKQITPAIARPRGRRDRRRRCGSTSPCRRGRASGASSRTRPSPRSPGAP